MYTARLKCKITAPHLPIVELAVVHYWIGTGGRHKLASSRVAACLMHAWTSGGWSSAKRNAPPPVMPWKKRTPPATNVKNVANAIGLKPPSSALNGVADAFASASAASLASVAAACSSATVAAGCGHAVSPPSSERQHTAARRNTGLLCAIGVVVCGQSSAAAAASRASILCFCVPAGRSRDVSSSYHPLISPTPAGAALLARSASILTLSISQ